MMRGLPVLDHLEPARVTVASRVMLPATTAFMILLGFNYTFDPKGNIAAAGANHYPAQVMGGSMQPWGWMFAALGVLMLAALFTGRRIVFVFALAMACCAWLLWAYMYYRSSREDPAASAVAWGWPLFVATS